MGLFAALLLACIGTTPSNALCNRSHTMEGHAAVLSQRSHGVDGIAILKDACTLELRDFDFDGAGVDVQVYLAKYPDWEGSGVSISNNLVRNQPWEGATLTFPLPLSLPDFNAISIWCVPFGVSFGDGIFAAPDASPMPPPAPRPPSSPVKDPPGCSRMHAMVGYEATLTDLSTHGVGGTATIVDGCTIALRDFNFDGAGVDVRVFLGLAQDNFDTGFSISGNLVRAMPYSQAMLSFALPENPADFGSLSIWCVTFGVDFGSGTFTNPSSLLLPPSPPPSSSPSPSC